MEQRERGTLQINFLHFFFSTLFIDVHTGIEGSVFRGLCVLPRRLPASGRRPDPGAAHRHAPWLPESGSSRLQAVDEASQPLVPRRKDDVYASPSRSRWFRRAGCVSGGRSAYPLTLSQGSLYLPRTKVGAVDLDRVILLSALQVKICLQNKRSKFKKLMKQGGGGSEGSVRWPTAGRCLPVPRRCRPAAKPQLPSARARAAPVGLSHPQLHVVVPSAQLTVSSAATSNFMQVAPHLPASSFLSPLRPGPSLAPSIRTPSACPGSEKKAQWEEEQ